MQLTTSALQEFLFIIYKLCLHNSQPVDTTSTQHWHRIETRHIYTHLQLFSENIPVYAKDEKWDKNWERMLTCRSCHYTTFTHAASLVETCCYYNNDISLATLLTISY